MIFTSCRACGHQSEFCFFCFQDSSIGTKITTVSTLDLDSPDSPISYSLTGDDGVLTIDARTGDVTTARHLTDLEGRELKATVTGE